jgi:hypothetical protein
MRVGCSRCRRTSSSRASLVLLGTGGCKTIAAGGQAEPVIAPPALATTGFLIILYARRSQRAWAWITLLMIPSGIVLLLSVVL